MIAPLKPVERPRALSEQVYHQLRGHMRDGTIVAGQPLQEVQIAAQLGVSRTPVREALRQLAIEGLLVSDGRSYIVPELTLADLDDIYEIRFLIETHALSSIAPMTSNKKVRRAIDEALQDAIAAHDVGDADAFRDANIRFRAAWLALVPNPRLVRVVEQYADHMHRIRALTLGDPAVRSIVLHGLKAIQHALAKGDGPAAGHAMREHLTEAKHAFIRAIGLEDESGKVQRA